MTRLGFFNGLAVAGAFALAVVLGSLFEATREPAAAHGLAPKKQNSEALRDERGVLVPLREYGRIASASIVSDFVLWELLAPERIAAYTSRSVDHPLYGSRFVGKPRLNGVGEIEPILTLAPDLVLMNHFADPRHAAQLHEHGIEVFDLGQMRGLDSLLEDIRQIGVLVGEPARADAMAERLQQRMRRIAAHVPPSRRPKGLYLAVYTSKLFGGAAHTSYHDVLTSAGVVDVAAEHHDGWPQLDVEQILVMDPDVIVTKRGMGAVLCQMPGFSGVRPCSGRGRMIEMEPNLIDEPGPPMLDAAEALYQAVHGDGARSPADASLGQRPTQ